MKDTPGPRIREAAPADRASWLRLRHSLWPGCSDHKHDLEMRQLLQSGGAVFVAEDDRANLIGFPAPLAVEVSE